MSGVFVDTSAMLALLVPSDNAHALAKAAFTRLSSRQAPLLTTSYVLVETYALLGRRLGIDAVRAFRTDFAPLLRVVWVAETLHERALDELLKRTSRTLSLVDVTSFLIMRDRNIDEAFAYDRHFDREGFLRV